VSRAVQPEAIMGITLNHTIVPARDKDAAARFFAEIFGLSYRGKSGHFAPVKVNDALTFLFSDEDAGFESHHYAFHVTDADFDAIFGRVGKAGLIFGSTPWSAEDGKLNDWGGGRGVYFRTPDGHLLELMTVPQ
jgi:catechol 2,3-dioxygenase-like lactoylglutathione lyase family enzyme